MIREMYTNDAQVFFYLCLAEERGEYSRCLHCPGKKLMEDSSCQFLFMYYDIVTNPEQLCSTMLLTPVMYCTWLRFDIYVFSTVTIIRGGGKH